MTPTAISASSIESNLQALPAFFEAELRNTYGTQADRILKGFTHARPTTLRANTLRATKDQVADELTAHGFAWQNVPWYKDAFVLEDEPSSRMTHGANDTGGTNADTASRTSEFANAQPPSEQSFRQSFWDSPLIKQGLVYVQSLSSMLPPLFLRLAGGLDVLDMCAAPGGKTTQIAALGQSAAKQGALGQNTPAQGSLHITACEQNAIRADKLSFNLRKQGAENVVIMRQDARRLDSFFSFDRILLDAPCSGSGTINRYDPKLGKRFSEALVNDSCKKQAALLSKALEIVKPGGVVLYSTCSVLKQENEAIVSAALKKAAKKGAYAIDALPTEKLEQQGVPLLPSAIEGAITICPTALYEGFFMCRIVRKA